MRARARAFLPPYFAFALAFEQTQGRQNIIDVLREDITTVRFKERDSTGIPVDFGREEGGQVNESSPSTAPTTPLDPSIERLLDEADRLAGVNGARGKGAEESGARAFPMASASFDTVGGNSVGPSSSGALSPPYANPEPLRPSSQSHHPSPTSMSLSLPGSPHFSADRHAETPPPRPDPADREMSDEMRQLSFYLPPGICEAYDRRGLSTLFRWQAGCLQTQGVLEGRSIVYCAPTSGGKTLVAEILLLKRVVETGRQGLVVLPFVALCEEKVRQLQALLDGFVYVLSTHTHTLSLSLSLSLSFSTLFR